MEQSCSPYGSQEENDGERGGKEKGERRGEGRDKGVWGADTPLKGTSSVTYPLHPGPTS